MSSLYLEDYFELVDQLPQEVIDNLTSNREFDLQSLNSLDKLHSKTTTFFENIIHMNSGDIEKEHNNIMEQYKKALEDSDEKITIVRNMAETMGKYVRYMEQDLLNFKVELEADNPGCTEIIEKRVEERRTFQITKGKTKDKSKAKAKAKSKASSKTHRSHNSLKRNTGGRRQNVAVENHQRKGNATATLPVRVEENHVAHISLSGPIPSTSSVVFSMDQTSPGGSAIVAAASQAIAATQQMQQGRRTASLKASFEAINSAGVPTSPFPRAYSSDSALSKELVAGAAQTAVAATKERRKKRRRRRKTGNTSSFSAETSAEDSSSMSAASSQTEIYEESIATTDPIDMIDPNDPNDPIDPNEPRYCVCNQVAFGNMIGCDNEGCPVEWYHYTCIGMKEAPKGKWYCSQCTPTVKKRSHKKHHT